jgi:preprotein translocase subunit YajC
MDIDMKKIPGIAAVLVLCFLPVFAQTQEHGGVNALPGDNVVGKVTAVNKDSLTIAPLMGGEPVTVKVSEATRVSRDRQPAKLEDIKVDETIFARGELKSNVMQAALVGVVNPEMIQRMQQGGGPGGGNMAGFNREDLGKKFIIGEVKSINETRLTIARPDGQTQEIEVDENTSFKKGAESITLPDIKAGDLVRGRGELKDNVFVPKELIVGRGGQMRIMMGGPGGQAQDQKKPESTPPAGTAPSAPPK